MNNAARITKSVTSAFPKEVVDSNKKKTIMMTRTLTREDLVEEFVNANPNELSEKTAWVCFDEEVTELFEAGIAYMLNPSEETRAAFIKEMADTQYTLSQLAVRYSVPLRVALNRVHANNMTKVVDGKIRLREDGKVLKPEGYVPADMSGL